MFGLTKLEFYIGTFNSGLLHLGIQVQLNLDQAHLIAY